MKATRVEDLARSLYESFAGWQATYDGVAVPKWQFLREDLRERFIALAEDLLLEDRESSAQMPWAE